MFISGNRFRTALVGSVLCGLFAITGCAAIGTDGGETAGDSPSRSAASIRAAKANKRVSKRQSIVVESIRSSSDGSGVIVNTSDGRVKYTVFKLNNPSRLVIDMPDVDLSKVTGGVIIQNDYVTGVDVQPMAEGLNIGRLVIGLVDNVDYNVVANANLLMVSLAKIPPVQEEAAASSDKESPSEAEEVATPAEKDVPAVEPIAKEAVKPASGITGVTVASVSGNTVLTIALNGAAGEYSSFVLDKPTRLVIDMSGIKNLTGKGTFKLKEKYIKSVRIAEHQGKVRLVVDSPDKKLPEYLIAKDGTTLQLNLGTPPFPMAKEEATPAVAVAAKAAEPVQAVVPVVEPVVAEAAVAPVEAVKAEPVVDESAKVTMVDFRKLNGNGRLTIVRSKKTELTVVESPDGKTLMLDLMQATLMNDLKRTLDASKLKTPVVAISSYQESEVPVKDVRVLVKLTDKTKYEVMETDTAVSVDFKTPVSEVETADAQSKGVDVAANIESNSGDEADNDKKKVFTGKKIDIDMVDANINDIFRLIAEVSNFNIIASDDIKGTITLRLKNVPWDQAFDIILKSKDLGISKIGNVIRVAPAATLRKEKESLMASKKAQEKLEPLEIKFAAINFATASDLESHVKGVLTDRGSVSSEKRTNTLIIKDVKKGIADAESVIASLDNPIPQVQIEARIVEAESSFTRDLGIQWGIDANQNSGDRTSQQMFGSTSQNGQTAGEPGAQFASTEGDLSTTNNVKNKWPVQAGSTNYAVNLPAASTLGALGFIVGNTGSNPFILDLRLSAGEKAGRLKTISRPRVTTLDNKEAKIQQGESIPFETTGATGTTVSFIDANLSLTVTPHITPDGSVLMQIKASRNSIGTFRSSSGVPSINKKEASTEVLVIDGETTVIGGIIISETNDAESGIPYLKEIPLLGWLFKSKSMLDNQKELLIFITPTIIKEKAIVKETAA